MNAQRFGRLFLVFTLASILLGAITLTAARPVDAGSNGQQLKIYYSISTRDCPVQVDVWGPNQNGTYTHWNDRGLSSCDTWYMTADKYWWKGRIWVQVKYRRPNGTYYYTGSGWTVPTTYASDFYPICLPGAANCRR